MAPVMRPINFVDSDDESEDAGEDVVMYQCRHCPDQQFTEAETSAHRQMHKAQKRRRDDASSGVSTEGSYFQPVSAPPKNGKQRKIRSDKTHKSSVPKRKYDGG